MKPAAPVTSQCFGLAGSSSRSASYLVIVRFPPESERAITGLARNAIRRDIGSRRTTALIRAGASAGAARRWRSRQAAAACSPDRADNVFRALRHDHALARSARPLQAARPLPHGVTITPHGGSREGSVSLEAPPEAHSRWSRLSVSP